MRWLIEKLRRQDRLSDVSAEEIPLPTYEELLAVNADLGFRVERMAATCDAADRFMGLMCAVDGKGAFLVSLNVDKDAQLADHIREAAWELQTTLYGGPVPVPVHMGATLH